MYSAKIVKTYPSTKKLNKAIKLIPKLRKLGKNNSVDVQIVGLSIKASLDGIGDYDEASSVEWLWKDILDFDKSFINH